MSRSYKKNKYTKSKAIDTSCRCHGGCPYCLSNRMHSDNKKKMSADYIYYEDINEEQDESI